MLALVRSAYKVEDVFNDFVDGGVVESMCRIIVDFYLALGDIGFNMPRTGLQRHA